MVELMVYNDEWSISRMNECSRKNEWIIESKYVLPRSIYCVVQ